MNLKIHLHFLYNMNKVYKKYMKKFKKIIKEDEVFLNFELIKKIKKNGLKIGLVSTSKRCFIDLLLEVFALLTGVLSPTFALISCCVLIILLYLCLIATIDYDKKNRKIESFIISKNSDGSFVIAVLYRHREQFAIYRIESITNLKIENKTIIIKLKGYFLYSDDEKFNDNGTITLPAVYDDELIDDINKLKG